VSARGAYEGFPAGYDKISSLNWTSKLKLGGEFFLGRKGGGDPGRGDREKKGKKQVLAN